MLDVHILVMDYTPADWLEQCLASVRAAAARAPFMVAIHPMPGVVGHLGQARERGYSAGEQRYVTHVDDDDWLEPDAFAALTPYFRVNADAITTGEFQVIKDVRYPVTNARHHLAVYRRELLTESDYASFRFHPDQRLLAQANARPAGIAHVERCLYNCRVYDTSGSRLQRVRDPDGARAEMERIRKPDLFIAEAYTPAQIAAMLEQP